MNKPVLFVVDNALREVFGARLVSRYLNRMGFNTILGSRFAFHEYYLRYRPEAVVFPSAYWDFGDTARSSYVFVLPSESGNCVAEQVRGCHAGGHSPVFPHHVDRFFCWGSAMREILLDSGRWKTEQLSDTGSPATDHWLLPPKSPRADHLHIGLTTTFRALSNALPMGKTNYFQWLDEAERMGGSGTYYRPPEHAESWLFFEASLARVMLEVVRAVTVERELGLAIRPHPFEREDRYNYFRRISEGRATVSKEGPISDWLDGCGVLFTCLSASSIDAFVRGIPVVSLKGLVDADAVRKIPAAFHYPHEDLMWQLHDRDQISEYVSLASEGKLSRCQDEAKMSDLLQQHFAYPRLSTAAELIAAEIAEFLAGDGARRIDSARRTGRRGARKISNVVRSMPCVPQTILFGRYLMGYLSERAQSIGLSYCPWRRYHDQVAFVDQIYRLNNG